MGLDPTPRPHRGLPDAKGLGLQTGNSIAPAFDKGARYVTIGLMPSGGEANKGKWSGRFPHEWES